MRKILAFLLAIIYLVFSTGSFYSTEEFWGEENVYAGIAKVKEGKGIIEDIVAKVPKSSNFHKHVSSNGKVKITRTGSSPEFTGYSALQNSDFYSNVNVDSKPLTNVSLYLKHCIFRI